MSDALPAFPGAGFDAECACTAIADVSAQMTDALEQIAQAARRAWAAICEVIRRAAQVITRWYRSLPFSMRHAIRRYACPETIMRRKIRRAAALIQQRR